MVGKLARWLRILGYDVSYSNRYGDEEIIQIALEEDRIILTRDTGLLKRNPAVRCLLIESGNLDEQARQVLRSFSTGSFNLFSRCLECNRELEPADKESVFERVPPYVYLTQDQFAVCPDCQRVYWAGTHTGHARKRVRSWFES